MFRLRTYEDDDQVLMNITFTETIGSEAYIVYKKVGSASYLEERIDLAPNQNLTYSFSRSELSDKDIYVVAKALDDYSGSNFSVKLVTIREDIPKVIPDNSFIATMALSFMILSFAIIAAVKSFEYVEHRAMVSRKIVQ